MSTPNAFDQLAPKKAKKKAPPQFIDVSLLTIADDPMPAARVLSAGSKYEAFFSRMKPGQCIRCEPDEAARLGQALRKWLVENDATQKLTVVSTSFYKKDGRGRVWLVQKDNA